MSDGARVLAGHGDLDGFLDASGTSSCCAR